MTKFAFSENENLMQFDNPTIEKTSDRGLYLIQLKAGDTSDYSALPLEIVFLNASLPYPLVINNTSFSESNTSTQIVDNSGISVPATLEKIIPIKNYDLVIYSNDGKELWKKMKQKALTGRAEHIVNLNNYTGNITISINDIIMDNKSSLLYRDRLSEHYTNLSDSVSFTTNILKK